MFANVGMIFALIRGMSASYQYQTTTGDQSMETMEEKINELRDEVERITGEAPEPGSRVLDVLKSMDGGVVVSWGCIPENVLDETF